MKLETKQYWIWAMVLPLLLFLGQTMCTWPAPWWLGEISLALMLGKDFVILPLLFAPFFATYLVIKGILKRSEPGELKQCLLSALACFCFVVLCLQALIQGNSVRRNAFARASKSGDQIVQALTQYKGDHGEYPSALDQLCPDYLNKIPGTGLIGYPPFWYWKDHDDQEHKRGEYELRINCSSGNINFDRFIYWPSEKYPDHIQGNGVERIGKWAYVHE